MMKVTLRITFDSQHLSKFNVLQCMFVCFRATSYIWRNLLSCACTGRSSTQKTKRRIYAKIWPPHTGYDYVWQVFKQFDRTNTGTINKDDLTQILSGGHFSDYGHVLLLSWLQRSVLYRILRMETSLTLGSREETRA